MKSMVSFLIVFVSSLSLQAQFTREDSLRGSLNEHRDWWDVLRYDITVTPYYDQKTITGISKIIFTKIKEGPSQLQIDLQAPLKIDSVLNGTEKIKYLKASRNTWLAELKRKELDAIDSLIVYYSGTPKEAKDAPWDGGWIWAKDSLKRPWMTAAVQGLGASAWYPCKDHQSDEPDNGASLTMIVADTLVAIGNGRLLAKTPIPDTRSLSYKWEVTNPINSYNIIPYIGNYINFTDTLIGAKGILDLSYWVLDYNLPRAKQQFRQVKPVLRCFEHWFGPFPFYEDSYKLVDAPHLGMEHQSAIAYGNRYLNGYRGEDRSNTGWGLQWDFIIVHESGHEWFANSITSKDVADMWIHEGFTNYSETLYTGWLVGKEASNEYNWGLRTKIRNDQPIIGPYGVNKHGSGDMYDKASNMVHIIRNLINDDEKFRYMLRRMNEVFAYKSVNSRQIEYYLTEQSGINLQKVFDQYLRTVQIPQLEYYFDSSKKHVFYRWTNCVNGFDMPLVINNKMIPITTKWNTTTISKGDLSSWKPLSIEKQYYITAKLVSKP